MLVERQKAFEAILNFETKGIFIKENELSPFANEIAFGYVRRKLFLEYVIRKNVSKMPQLKVRVLLAIGIYQLFFMDSVPPHAALNTTVELAKTLKHSADKIPKFINAVLHTVLKKGLPEYPEEILQKTSLQYSLPLPLLKCMEKTFGKERAICFAKKHLQKPAWWIRANIQKTTAEKLALLFRIPAENIFHVFIKIPESVSLKELLKTEAFKSGLFSVQNPAASDVINLLDLKPDLTLWDACAAPGGKTAFIAETVPGIFILATDISEERLKSIQDLSGRLSLKNISTKVLDATKEIPDEIFDRILLDVPCSNLGVLDKRPEAVYRLNETYLKELQKIQYQILENASKALKPGGVLVYATCSPEKMETTDVIEMFLKKHSEFKMIKEPVYSGSEDFSVDNFFAIALIKS